MYLPEYTAEINNSMFGNAMMNKAIQEYMPSPWGVFKQSASYAFNDNSFIHAYDYLDSFTTPSGVITEEEFDEKFGSESNITYEEGITERQAQILQQSIERDKFYARYMRNTSMLSLGGITGMVAGSVLDPINYIPFVGWAGRISKVARIAGKIPMLGMTANAMLGQTTFEVVKQTHLKSLGKDVNWAGAMIDVGMAGVLGMGLGGLGSLSGLAKKMRLVDIETHNQNLTVALTANSDRTPTNNMQVNDIDPITTVAPETIVDPDPVTVRMQKEQTHEANFNSKNKDLDKTQEVNIVKREDGIKKFTTCKGL